MNTGIVDYAYPCMMAENALRKAHQAMLAKSYDEAIELTETAAAECRLMAVSIRHMKEQENALRK